MSEENDDESLEGLGFPKNFKEHDHGDGMDIDDETDPFRYDGSYKQKNRNYTNDVHNNNR